MFLSLTFLQSPEISSLGRGGSLRTGSSVPNRPIPVEQPSMRAPVAPVAPVAMVAPVPPPMPPGQGPPSSVPSMAPVPPPTPPSKLKKQQKICLTYACIHTPVVHVNVKLMRDVFFL